MRLLYSLEYDGDIATFKIQHQEVINVMVGCSHTFGTWGNYKVTTSNRVLLGSYNIFLLGASHLSSPRYTMCEMPSSKDRVVGYSTSLELFLRR